MKRKAKCLFGVVCMFLCMGANVLAAGSGTASERMNLDLMKKVNSVRKNKVVVAVIDTGVQTNLFPDRCEAGYNATTENGTESVQDVNGHGTEVASVIVNHTPDNVKILPIKVGDGDNIDLSGDDTEEVSKEAVIQAFDYACEHADIINFCCGYDGEDAAEQSFLNTSIDRAVAKGIPVIVSAGNQYGETDSYPACHTACWTVGAIDGNNSLADFSNYGSFQDFVAPGVGISVISRTGESVVKSGTSFAAPYVTAFAANLMGKNTYASTESLYNGIRSFCEDLGSTGFDVKFGYGIPVYRCAHEQTSVVVQTESSCTENGTAYRICQDCSEITETISLTAPGHSWKNVSIAPTLVSTGSSYEYCTICGAVQNVKTSARLSSATKIKVSKRKSTSFTITWSKVNGASGYRIVCGSKSYTTTGTKLTVKKLKAGTVYKIAVQPYTIYNGSKKYGNATFSKNVTTCAKVTGIKKLKNKVTWKKVSASGYEVCYAKKKNFKSSKRLFVKSSSKKIKKGYYVKVRAYRMLNGKKVYGPYSKTIKV